MSDHSTEASQPASQPLSYDRATQHLPFQFLGTGGEFFRIWIVNVLLTLATLGIYSAWAKVRTMRYLYGNTEVAGDRFDYHAKPLTILKGRVIAIALLLVYVVLSELLPIVGLVLLLALLIALPWIVVRSLRFNAQMSSWRNIRFNFTGTPGGAAGAYLGWPILGVFTLGLGLPFAWYKAAQFGVNGHSLGRTPFRLSATAGDFYIMALIIVGVVIGGGLVLSLLSGGLVALQNFDPESGFPFAAVPVLILISLFYLMVFALFGGLRFRLIYQNLGLGENRVNNNMPIGTYLYIAVTNTLLMLLTLGLYYPWAKIRMTAFLVDSLTVEAVDVNSFVAAEQDQQSALGEELGEAFDLGIGV